MAYRPPRFITPFRNDYEQDDNFEATPYLSSRRIAPLASRLPGSKYQDPNAEKGAADYRSEIDKLYGTGEAMEKFYSHVQNTPRPEDYGPGILGRITAGLAGASSGYFGGAGQGIGVAQKVLRRPYEQAVEQYELKGQGLKAAADIEQARDAKRVAYFKELREFDKDAYDRLYKEAQVENQRITADARAAQAETSAKLADLTQRRDEATDDRERKKLSAEIEKTKGDLKLRQQAEDTRLRGVKAFEARTGVTERLGNDRNKRLSTGTKPREVVISPQAQNAAEVSAAGDLLNQEEFKWLKDQGIVTVNKDYIDIAGRKKTAGGWFGTEKEYNLSPEDKIVLERFRSELEKEKKKKLSQTIKLNMPGSDDEIDFDLDDDEP